jgi:hypothetical protein
MSPVTVHETPSVAATQWRPYAGSKDSVVSTSIAPAGLPLPPSHAIVPWPAVHPLMSLLNSPFVTTFGAADAGIPLDATTAITSATTATAQNDNTYGRRIGSSRVRGTDVVYDIGLRRSLAQSKHVLFRLQSWIH